MNAPGHDAFANPSRVVLARESPFRLGALHVEPATRQVRSGTTRELLEPRVMQVLVALFRAKGEAVTRDELIEYCWSGRIVSDDAVNRVLSRIRRLARGLARGSFAIETIPRVGYRLRVLADAAKDEPRIAWFPGALSRRAILAGAASAGALIAAGGVAFLTSGSRGQTSREAKALYERAIAVQQEERSSSNRQAIAYLSEAVRLAPDYGQAWGALALAYRSALMRGPPERVPGFVDRLGEAVHNAERYDPGNSDAAAAKLPRVGTFGHWLEHERVARRTIGRHPDHPVAYSFLASILMDTGRWGDAAAILHRAKALAPASPLTRYKLTVALWSSGQPGAAETEVDEALRRWPEHGAIWQTKIKLLALTDRPHEALAIASNPALIPPEAEDAPNNEGRILYLRALWTRASEDVERSLANILNTARAHEFDRAHSAFQAAMLGRSDLALDILEGVYMRSGSWALTAPIEWLATHPLFQPHARGLWASPRFDRLLAAVGLEDYWLLTKSGPDYRR